jgi:antitoxin VapB
MSTRKTAGTKRPTLYVKNPAARRLAEQVGERMGVNLSEAVIAALEESLRKTERRPLNRAKVEALCTGFDALKVIDSRTAEEILGYDSHGIPR